MFVKQHFIADVVTAIVLAAVVFGAQVVWGVSMRRFVPKPIMRLVLGFEEALLRSGFGQVRLSEAHLDQL